MLNRLNKNICNRLVKSIQKYSFAGASGFHVGDKAPTMLNSSIPINIENADGSFSRISGFVGKSLYRELRENHINIGGYCGGGRQQSLRDKPVEKMSDGPFCRGCYCIVDEPWYSKMGEVHNYEALVLNDLNENYPQNTRFTCSIVIESWMKELTLRIPTIKGEVIVGEEHDNTIE